MVQVAGAVHPSGALVLETIDAERNASELFGEADSANRPLGTPFQPPISTPVRTPAPGMLVTPGVPARPFRE